MVKLSDIKGILPPIEEVEVITTWEEWCHMHRLLLVHNHMLRKWMMENFTAIITAKDPSTVK